MNIPLKQYWDLLKTYLRPQWPRVLVLSVLLFGSVGLELLNPQILRIFINTVAAHGSLTTLLVSACVYLGIALLDQVVKLGATYFSERVKWTATNELRFDLAAHTLALDMPFHNTHTPGEMIERIDGDVNTLSNFFSQFIVQLVGSMALLLGILVLLYREDWLVGLSFTVFSLLVLLVLQRIRVFMTEPWEHERQASAELFGFLEERLAGLADIRANGAQAYVMLNFYRFMRTLFLKGRRAFYLADGVWWLAINPLFLAAEASTFILGAYLFSIGKVSIGTVFLFFSYLQMLRNPLEQIASQLQDLQKASASIERIRKLYNIQRSIRDGSGTELPSGPLAVNFQDVSFAYHDEDWVLQDITLHIPAGKTLGLLGHTGSGKTSLTRLLFRLYEANAGEIRLGGVDIGEVSLKALRERVSIVTQEVQLFQGTLRDNLTFFDRRVSDERILRALQELGLEQWYQTLPEGLDTELMAGGRGLSAGEAQLVAFARVFLADPGLVILDEASSRLDPATEQLIQRAIERLLSKRTGIIIAHRLATVQRVDDILILERGRIREYASRGQLAQDPDSFFYHLLQTGLEEVMA